MCGEHTAAAPTSRTSSGSSPRVRGTRFSVPGRRHRQRFIPACAGNTRECAASKPTGTVHPRVCGEHTTGSKFAFSDVGSSPRVRGTPVADRRFQVGRRFIPACAGNTTRSRSTARSTSVHPRVCGEHPILVIAALARCGSSPRVRGTPHRRGVRRGIRRFIPACAGNTISIGWLVTSITVHPRVCGEHPGAELAVRNSVGSSPRVRGTLVLRYAEGSLRRFIPACAGNTGVQFGQHCHRPVHPRVCGEHGVIRGAVKPLAGSSPRVRGTRVKTLTLSRRGRFIPACAGNTTNKKYSQGERTVHPRVCGEHSSQKALK